MTRWERALRAPPDSRSPRWLTGAVLLAFLACVAAAAWLVREPVRPAPRVPSVSEVRPRPAEPPAAPVAPSSTPAATRPPMRTVGKCVAPDGRTVGYGDGACPNGTQQFQVIVEPDLNLVDGMTAEQREAHLQANRTAAMAQQQHEEAVARNPGTGATGECRALDQWIAQLDAWGRQPNDPQTLNDIRNKRQSARDRQFRLGCGSR